MAHSTTLDWIAQAIFDKKGMNILGLDVRGHSSMTDAYILAEGTVNRHVMAIARAIIEDLKERDVFPLRIEGMKEGSWVVIDYGDVIVHLLDPDTREKYQLEKIWREGKVIPLKIIVNKV